MMHEYLFRGFIPTAAIYKFSIIGMHVLCIIIGISILDAERGLGARREAGGFLFSVY